MSLGKTKRQELVDKYNAKFNDVGVSVELDSVANIQIYGSLGLHKLNSLFRHLPLPQQKVYFSKLNL